MQRSMPRAQRSPPGRRLPAGQRAATFTKAAAAIEARAEQVAQDMTAEMGKPLREARLETLRAATILRYAAGEAYRPVGRAVRAVGRRPAPLHAAPSTRCRRPDHAVELPDRDPGVEARAGADLREHARAQARVRGSAHRASRGRVLRRGGAARRRAERAYRSGLEGRRRDRLQPRRARDLVHGLGAGRPLRARRGDCARLPRPARARRAQPADRDGVGGARSGRRGRVRGRLLVGRAEVHGDAAHPRRRVRLRRVSREAARTCRRREGGRPRPTRMSRSAPS